MCKMTIGFMKGSEFKGNVHWLTWLQVCNLDLQAHHNSIPRGCCKLSLGKMVSWACSTGTLSVLTVLEILDLLSLNSPCLLKKKILKLVVKWEVYVRDENQVFFVLSCFIFLIEFPLIYWPEAANIILRLCPSITRKSEIMMCQSIAEMWYLSLIPFCSL